MKAHLRRSWLGLLLGLAACAGGPPAADWQVTAHAALEAHVRAYLSGNRRVAAQELRTARQATARTGQAAAMARIELTACAAQLASLDALDSDAGCIAFAPLAVDADAAARAYADYLAGRWAGLDAALLPPAQRDMPTLRDANAAPPALAAIADPLSRLVAAAALLRAGQLPPAGVALAIDTAAAQGWTRPLLAWLTLDLQRLDAAGDAPAAAARRRQRARILQAIE